MTQSEKLKFRDDEDVLKELCAANGVSYEKVAHEGLSVSFLEIFFSGFPRMVGLSFFPRLCQLTIVGQSLENIEGLECCPMLRELWVVQCRLMDITGLENCLQLEKLYLYDNQISKIQNLQMQIHLQILWLNSNCINEIQGLDNLQNLRELNLADNSIETIGRSLEPNSNLQNLNLSGNRIRSFKELTYLAHLPRLTELALNDPTSAPNPVCLLCNYATHVLYHMPSLQYLDTYEVSSSQIKEIAESTVMKKIMYYNMRVRTAQRNLAEMVHSLTEKRKTMLQIPEESIRTLSHSFKNLERELSRVTVDCKVSMGSSLDEHRVEPEDQTNGTSIDPNMEEKIVLKMDSLRERLTLWTKKINEMEALYEQDVAQVTSCMEYTVQFLLMELESVGNIRLEEGYSTDPWFSSCCDLLLSRFSFSDYRAYDITEVKINKVIRIHNSALRLRFEEKLQTLLSEESSRLPQNYRRRLEHLFYVPNPEKVPEKEDILQILEEGFKTAEHFKALGREEAIPLSNSLSLSEQYRIEFAVSNTNQASPKRVMDNSLLRHGRVVLSKVFLGNSTSVRNGESVEKSNYPTADSVYLNIGTKHRNTTEEVPNSAREHAGPESCRQQRKWFIFDNELVLPEYIIFFEYITVNEETANQVYSTQKSGTSPSEIIVDREVLNMEPVLRPQPKLLILDDKILLSVAQANVLSQITVLNLHGNSLNKLKDISHLTALRHLSISFNEFTRLDDIRHMHNLEFLDVSFNRLVTLEGMRGLSNLKQLDVRWNKLTKAREDTAVLTKHTPALLKLDTRHNPWKKKKSVRMTLLTGLKSLTHLDDELITEEETTQAVRTSESRITQMCLLLHSSTNSKRPRSLSLLSTAHFLCGLSRWDISQNLQPDWMAMITALNLDGQRISKLTNLSGLVNLRWASFNDNDISKVEGLDSCQKLEELSLNNNGITTLTGLLKLHSLNRLSLDGNQLTFLEASTLEQLPNLTFLSLDKNFISSLHGIQRVRSLLELYVGNNHISTTRDIYYLKGLTNLIILDLHGNPLIEKLENYRIYVVFQISSLKALDGIAVEVTEYENAKDMFSGRLTADMVAEKLGHSNYTDITYLSMPSCSIRMVDLSPGDLFSSLRSVNLDHNNLTSFSGLIYLPNIKCLSVNYNKIESILPRQKAQTQLTNRQILYNKVHSSGYGQQGQTKSIREAVPIGGLEPLMGSLEELHLSHNGISNMANLQLSRLTNLKALFLQGNEISQVEGLEGLHLLRELVLDKNRIKVFSEHSFVGQTALLELHLSENRIRELNHMEHMTELRKLFLGSNKLQDTAELEKLEALPSLTELDVVGNPVARNSFHRAALVLHLTQLQILDGVVVTVEERTRAELLNTEPSLLQPCPQFHGASVPSEINLPGLLPLMSQNTTLKAITMSGRLQNLIHGQDVSLTSVEEAQPQHNHRYKKHKHFNPARSGQSEMRPIRRTGGSLPSTSLLPDGNRVSMTNPPQEQEGRFSSGAKPSHM